MKRYKKVIQIELPDKCMFCGARCTGGVDFSFPRKYYECGSNVWVKEVNCYGQYILIVNLCANHTEEKNDKKCRINPGRLTWEDKHPFNYAPPPEGLPNIMVLRRKK